ncbi:MAG: YdiU family protein, partial [Robiginitomaculum sp.]|nr:YdiU family protein [Robiginitomaculum sp.]
IARHFPHIKNNKNPPLELLNAVIADQANLMAMWMGLGFIHGVMNTDNMQIAGETLDYGPCAFMDDFHPQKVFSSIDHHGRYAWGQQPHMAVWNLTQLAQSLSPLLGTDESEAALLAQKALAGFNPLFNRHFNQLFAVKMGLSVEQDRFGEFITSTFKIMAEQEIDFTLFFRKLTQVASNEETDGFTNLFQDVSIGEAWLKQWQQNVKLSDAKISSMKKTNPIYIPRNHRIEQVIQAGRRGDFAPFERLIEILKTPYKAQKGHEEMENPPNSDEIITQTFCGT